MISALTTVPDISFLPVPIGDHAFFEQPQFQGLLGDDFFNAARASCDLAAGRRSGCIPNQPPLAGFHDCDAVLAPKAVEHDADTFTIRSDDGFWFTDFCLIFTDGYDEPEILLSSTR